ncbi:MAG: hypothetical protein ACFFAB_05815 [Candidatus Heimdallarchaeota archaeon]
MINFPNKCIKCKKEEPNLNEFTYAKAVLSKRFRIAVIKIPICDNCKKELMKYEKIMKILKTKFTFFCVFCSSIFLLFVWNVYNPTINLGIYIFTLILSAISGSMSLILLIGHILVSMKNYDRISNYIDITPNGKFLIRDPEYRKEFEELSTSKEDELFNCPSCNTLLMKDMEYCHVCGKKFRRFP